MARSGHRRTFLRESALTALFGFAIQASLLVSGPLSARLLGVEGRGHFASFYLWTTIVIFVGSLGIPTALTFHLADGRADRPILYADSLAITALQSSGLALLTWLLLMALCPSGRPDVQAQIPAFVLTVPATLIHQTSLAALQGLRLTMSFNFLRVAPTFFYAVSIIYLWHIQLRSLESVALAWAASMCVASLASTALAVQKLRPRFTPSAPRWRSLLSFGTRAQLGAVSPLDNLRLDQAVASIFLPPASLGLYVTAQAFTNVIRFFSESVGKALYPAVAACDSKKESQALLWFALRAVMAITIPTCAVVAHYLTPIVSFLFGVEFIGAVPIARVLLIGALLVAGRRILADGLRGMNHPAASSIAELSIYPWLFLAGPVAIGAYGLLGLAATVTSGHAIAFCVALRVALRLHHRLVPATSQRPAGDSHVRTPAPLGSSGAPVPADRRSHVFERH